MGKLSKKDSVYEETPKKRGRKAGVKTYKSRHFSTKAHKCGTLAKQYPIAFGELKARQPFVFKKFFVQKMYNSMRKPTGSSGIDDLTAKWQALNRSLYALEEGYMFGDSDDDDDEVMETLNYQTMTAAQMIPLTFNNLVH